MSIFIWTISFALCSAVSIQRVLPSSESDVVGVIHLWNMEVSTMQCIFGRDVNISLSFSKGAFLNHKPPKLLSRARSQGWLIDYILYTKKVPSSEVLDMLVFVTWCSLSVGPCYTSHCALQPCTSVREVFLRLKHVHYPTNTCHRLQNVSLPSLARCQR